MRLKRRTVLQGLMGLSLPLIAASCTSQSSSTQSGSTQSGLNSPSSINAQVSPSPTAASAAKTVRIGYQKATELDLLRTRGNLDKRIQDLGLTVEWALFPSGPPMLEAMNAGKLDFGGVGESPPIFSQAAGGQFYYVSVSALSPETQDIVVPQNSSIQTVADLKGKKIALQRGSSAHYLLLAVLKEQGIAANEVEVVPLSPADARAAFEQGNVDAWSIWDPFLAVIQESGNVKELKLGRNRNIFFLASQQFAKTSPELLKTVLDEAKQNGQWAKQNFRQIAEQFSKDVNVEASILEEVYQRRSWEVLPVDEQIQQSQQKVADIFYQSQIISRPIQVKETFLPADQYANIFPS
jgi:sulfonate transport system substrate-binding protein